MSFTRLSFLTATSMMWATLAGAHEFWIEPTEFQVQPDVPFEADLRNGQLFEGTRQSYSENSTTRLEIITGDQIMTYQGRLGDRPAIQLQTVPSDGLMVIAHEAAPSTLTYSEWQKFLNFVDHKDFSEAVATHDARGWSKENFKENYTRHSKSLVAVGDGEGADRALGLTTEFVALDNPYAADFDGVLDVALLYDGAPRVDAQIEVYARDSQNAVAVTILRTDEEGHAAIPVVDGMEYLLDAVVLRPVDGATTSEAGPVWETLWASMTFAVPVR